MVGIGIGLIISSILMLGIQKDTRLTKSQIEEKARSIGMDYPDNFKVIYDKEVSK